MPGYADIPDQATMNFLRRMMFVTGAERRITGSVTYEIGAVEPAILRRVNAVAPMGRGETLNLVMLALR